MKENFTINIPEILIKWLTILSMVLIIFVTGYWVGIFNEEGKMLSVLKAHNFYIYTCTKPANELSYFAFNVCKKIKPIRVVKKENVTVTGYSSSVEETDDTPFTTADGSTTQHGYIAVSDDLFNSGWTFNKIVLIKGIGTFVIKDRMNKRISKTVDIWYDTKSKAVKNGTKKAVAMLLE